MVQSTKTEKSDGWGGWKGGLKAALRYARRNTEIQKIPEKNAKTRPAPVAEIVSRLFFNHFCSKDLQMGGPHRAISAKTVHKLIANDRPNCGLWVN